MYQVRTTYAHPERMGRFPDDAGRVALARVPGHPTRPARAYEVNCWWEDVTAARFEELHRVGATLRIVGVNYDRAVDRIGQWLGLSGGEESQ